MAKYFLNIFLQVLPYCFVNTLTYVIGGMWYIHCDAIGKVATILADDFEIVLRHIGPSGKVADYRSLWMLLSRISRDFGTSCCYVLIFLCLYLFLVITLTIYGLLSQIQQGFGIKDIGLTVTAVNSIALLYFICDEAHYASNSVSFTFNENIDYEEINFRKLLGTGLLPEEVIARRIVVDERGRPTRSTHL